jgi:uncharacterized protein (TIGR02996 family)
MNAALEAAWDLALIAPHEDQGPWRVLADMLTEAGDPRGELMQLQLEAEQGALKGLAKGRLQSLQMKEEQPGQTRADATRPWRAGASRWAEAVRSEG